MSEWLVIHSKDHLGVNTLKFYAIANPILIDVQIFSRFAMADYLHYYILIQVIPPDILSSIYLLKKQLIAKRVANFDQIKARIHKFIYCFDVGNDEYNPTYLTK